MYKCKNGKAAHPRTAASIREEIYRNGDVEVAFTVYADFMNYESGIYTHKSGAYRGGHAVVAVGYGVENGVEYLICENSWGPRWGDKGFFKIKFGEVGINNQVYACEPEVAESSVLVSM